MWTMIAIIFGGILFFGFHLAIYFDKDIIANESEFMGKVVGFDLFMTVILIVIGAILNNTLVAWGFLMLLLTVLTTISLMAEKGVIRLLIDMIIDLDKK
jgi:hypothetical protein